jgi:hypothetical protein
MRRKGRKSVKTQILAVAALVLTALAPVPSHAQQLTQAKISFTFQAGTTTMPAGEYQVRRAFLESVTTELIRRTDSSASTFALANVVDSRDKKANPRLIFHCYNNECFLSEIWVGSGQGLKLLESRREQELSHAAAENELAVVSVPLTVTP